MDWNSRHRGKKNMTDETFRRFPAAPTQTAHNQDKTQEGWDSDEFEEDSDDDDDYEEPDNECDDSYICPDSFNIGEEYEAPPTELPAVHHQIPAANMSVGEYI
ncbi:hypothetical protein DNTS_015027, partial [Danionella cerebrum]